MALPLYVTNMLVPSVVARPLQGEPSTIDLMMGYNKSNTPQLLMRFPQSLRRAASRYGGSITGKNTLVSATGPEVALKDDALSACTAPPASNSKASMLSDCALGTKKSDPPT